MTFTFFDLKIAKLQMHSSPCCKLFIIYQKWSQEPIVWEGRGMVTWKKKKTIKWFVTKGLCPYAMLIVIVFQG